MKEEVVKYSGVDHSAGDRSTEVAVKPGRRRFTTAYIEQILKELDEAAHGQVGKILRREGIYSKTVSNWRQQRADGVKELKRGRKETPSNELRQKLAKQEREIHRLQRNLDQAEKIIEVQKKVSELLGIMTKEEDHS